ncbi:unnamed protein product [Ectocarpus sp. CCAP 1310/34]|nr:unnamed protein product [Ectocarpus sp. CCAP 1310/34]
MVSFPSAAWWVSRAVAGHAFTSHWSAVGNSGPCGCSRCWGRRRFCGRPCTSPPRTATTAADIDHQPSAGNAGDNARSEYVLAVLKAKLEAVQTEGKTLEDVEEEVARWCAGEGAILSTAKSTRCRDGATDRVGMRKLICSRGGKSRQLEYEASLDTAPGVLRRNVKGSARTGCPFEVSVRHAKSHRWPKISNMKLKHNHSVDRNAIDVQVMG